VPIPVENEEEEEFPYEAHYIPAGAPSTEECPGTVSAPKAAEGNLCVYAGVEILENAVFDAIAKLGGESGVDSVGAQIVFIKKAAGVETNIFVSGTWAVTATNIT